jgi:sRNA-binding carbon storage regulator CsrA
VTRKRSQSLEIHDARGNLIATVTLVDSSPSRARIGIEAPPEIRVTRRDTGPAKFLKEGKEEADGTQPPAR